MRGKIEVFKLGLGPFKYFLLHRLSPGVLAFKLRRLLAGLGGIGLRDQRQRAVRRAQPPARVQPGRQHEGDIGRGNPPAGHPRRLDQRLESGPPGGIVDGVQPQLHDGAVLAGERHHVGHRGQRRHIHPGHGRRLAAQRPHQLPGHAGPAQERERIAPQQRVHHRAGGQLALGRTMVVGDDHVQPQVLRQRHQLHAGHAAVHRHHQLCPARDPADGLLVQTVALAVAGRQVDPRVRPGGFEPAGQYRGSADAVHVVIPVDADHLARVHRRADAPRSRFHAAEQEGVQQIAPAGVQERLGLGGGGDAPPHQQRVQRLRHALGPGERMYFGVAKRVAEHVCLISFGAEN